VINWPWPGLDIRGDGGFAVLIGRNSNGPYVLLRDLEPDPWESLPTELQDYLFRYAHKSEADEKPVENRCNLDDVTALASVSPRATQVRHGRVQAELLLGRALEQARTDGRNNAGFLACLPIAR